MPLNFEVIVRDMHEAAQRINMLEQRIVDEAEARAALVNKIAELDKSLAVLNARLAAPGAAWKLIASFVATAAALAAIANYIFNIFRGR